jgi:RNA polymerase sigma-70 factor (ECF subfamily)
MLTPSSPVRQATLMHSEDLGLLERIRVGDRQAFADLYARHASQVLGLLTRILGNRAEAEEVMQDVFLQAWNQADRYRPDGSSPRGWLLLIARSRAVDRLRARGARERREREAGDAGVIPATEVVAATALRQVESKERWELIHEALADLPAEQRGCIELAFFEGLSQSQIAARLNAPLGTVKSRILLGMNKLREALGPHRAAAM